MGLHVKIADQIGKGGGATMSAHRPQLPIPSLPPSAQEIADIIGRDRALYLIGRLPPAGGRAWRRVLYVPKRMPPDHPLIGLLGPEDAERMRWYFGGSILQPANCGYIFRGFRDREICRMSEEGATVLEIAANVALSPKRIREILEANGYRAGKAPEETQPQNDDHRGIAAKGRAMRVQK